MKMLALACNVLKYVCNLEVYIGEKDHVEEDIKRTCASGDIIVRLFGWFGDIVA